MTSPNFNLRNILKPVLYKVFGESIYSSFLKLGKIQDIRQRLVEEPEMSLLPLVLRPGDVCIDIGANYAYYSQRLSQLVGTSGKIYSFEPIPSTYEVATSVLKWFKCDNVELYNLGVSNRDDEIEFLIPETEFGTVSAGLAHIGGRSNDFDTEAGYNFESHRKVMAKVVALDDLLLPKLNRLDFVKIDIEGAEMWAFEGMKQMLEKFNPVVLCEFSPRFLEAFNIDPKLWETKLRNEYAYEIFSYNPTSKKLLSQPEGALIGSNYIFVPRSRRNQFEDIITN